MNLKIKEFNVHNIRKAVNDVLEVGGSAKAW